MRLSSMTAIAEGPAAPLSPRMRAELRADRPPTPAPFVRSDSGRRLARALDRFARGDRDRTAVLVYGPVGSGRTTVVLRAVEQAMVALTWLARPVQLLPVPIRAGSVWGGEGDRFEDTRVVARHLAVAALTEVVERLGARADEGTERAAAVEALWQALAGLPDRGELRALRSSAEPRFALFGDASDDDGPDEEDEQVTREAEVLWQAARLRGVRPRPRAADAPAALPAIDPAIVDALRERLDRLTDALAERDSLLAEHLSVVGRSNDPFAVVLAALAGAALGVSIAGAVATGGAALAAGGVVGSVLGGGLGFVLGRNGSPGRETELPPVPEFAPLPEPALAPTPTPADDDDTPVTPDSPTDVDGLVDLLGHFIHDLRAVGYAPVFVFDELDAVDRAVVEPRITRLLSDLPDGCCSILVAETPDFAARAADIEDRLGVHYVPAALHAYLDRRVTLPGDLSETAEADARVDKAILRYALMHASRMKIEELERMLTERSLGGVRLDAQAPRTVYAFRLRAAQQIALERVLAERGAHRGGDPRFNRLLTRALQFPLELWETGQDPDITETTLAEHLDGGDDHGEWTTASAAERARIWSALSILLGLMSSRAGLVARLPDELAPLADLIPDAPLVVRGREGWHWAFDAHGQPTPAGLAADEPADDKPTRNLMPPKKRPDTGNVTLDALGADGFQAPKRLRPGDPLPVTGEFRAYSASLARKAADANGDSDDDSVDGTDNESLAGLRPGMRRPLIDATEAARFLEAVDEALGGVGDGALSVDRLARVGLVPTIPQRSAVARALTEGDTPHARIVLDEAVGRIRERLGVIEKFSLWLTAVRALVGDGGAGTIEIAASLVRARALRGRSTPDQHAHLVTRDLQGELRSLMPRVRLRSSIFRRQAAPGTDPEALLKWGEALASKNQDLADALRDGTDRETLTRVAWRALRGRLRKLVVDGQAGLPAFAEVVAALEGVAGATITDWLSPAPTARNLSALLLAAREHSTPDRLGDGGLYAALALGLNRNGTDAVGLELPPVETSEAGDLIRETVRARPPVALVLTTDPARGLAASPPPRRGSALVLTPDEVATSTRKLGFEVIFLDDPTIDAGLLPLPPAPVLAPPLAEDIDAALGWWVTHR